MCMFVGKHDSVWSQVVKIYCVIQIKFIRLVREKFSIIIKFLTKRYHNSKLFSEFYPQSGG